MLNGSIKIEQTRLGLIEKYTKKKAWYFFNVLKPSVIFCRFLSPSCFTPYDDKKVLTENMLTV